MKHKNSCYNRLDKTIYILSKLAGSVILVSGIYILITHLWLGL